MEVKTINKYQKKSIPDLIKLATKYFNSYIRKRDEGKKCVSCNQYKELQAGHFYSGGHYPALRFNEKNVHGQCVRCNMYLSGNLSEYRRGITERINEKGLSELDMIADMYKRTGYKWDRFNLIEIIEKYKAL